MINSDVIPTCTAPRSVYTFPAYSYGRTDGCSVVGGFVYRGSLYPAMVGYYVFADFCNGRMNTLNRAGANNFTFHEAGGTGIHVSTIGEDVNGELYIGEWQTSSKNNTIYKIRVKP